MGTRSIIIITGNNGTTGELTIRLYKHWDGNECISDKTFDSFDEAWGEILERFEHLTDAEMEIEMGEYQVLPLSKRLGTK